MKTALHGTGHRLVAVCGLALAACAEPVPPALAPPAGQRLAMVVPARGVQIYECRDTAAGPGWVFVAPDAKLLYRSGQPLGSHGAGPHWQAADGSRVVGSVKARIDAPRADSIPWLLLSAQADGPEGSFSRITSVQRIHTLGGLAPKGGCAHGSVGQRAQVAYFADYVFFHAANTYIKP